MVCIFFTGDSNEVLEGDVIEHEGKLWLVPHWIDNPALRTRQPVRIIRVDQLPRQDWRGRLVLTEPIPTAVLEGRARPEEAARFEVMEAPDIRIPFADPKAH